MWRPDGRRDFLDCFRFETKRRICLTNSTNRRATSYDYLAMQFADRVEAGRILARQLTHLAGRDGLLVLALPRGGVPVGYEVARSLGAPLDVFVVRKLGAPGQKELAMGAIASGGLRVLNSEIVSALGAKALAAIEAATIAETKELAQREALYRGARPFPDLRGRTIVLVDDGLATGATMRAAVQAVRARAPAAVIVAVPVAPAAGCLELKTAADEVICATTPESFFGVGQFYDDFRQVSDEEVRQWLALAASRPEGAPPNE
jgi:predicted phosphoribosyltransferase